MLELTPPLIITESEIDEGVAILAGAIKDCVHGRVDMEKSANTPAGAHVWTLNSPTCHCAKAANHGMSRLEIVL